MRTGERFWETLANGCLLISDPTNDWLRMPNPLIPGEHYVMFRAKEEIFEKLDYYLHHTKEAEKIALNGYHFAMAFHSAKARAKYMLKRFKLRQYYKKDEL